MAKVREIRRQIKSIDSTRQITKTMEMVAGAKIRRAQGRIEAARPYALKMMEVLYNVAAFVRGTTHPLLETHDPIEKALVVVFTSDRGLCGAFNTNVIRRAESVLTREDKEGASISEATPEAKIKAREKLKALFKRRTTAIEEAERTKEEKVVEIEEVTPSVEVSEEGKRKVDLIVIGRKGINYFKFIGQEIFKEYRGISDSPTIENAREIARMLMDMYVQGEVDKVYLVFNHFKSIVEQRPVEYLLLPMEREVIGEKQRSEASETEYIFEPKAKEVLHRLLPRYIETVVYRAFLESAASEHGARRTAMKNATDNANEIIQNLTRDYNNARQAQITQEISEIVGGAEALK